MIYLKRKLKKNNENITYTFVIAILITAISACSTTKVTLTYQGNTPPNGVDVGRGFIYGQNGIL